MTVCACVCVCSVVVSLFLVVVVVVCVCDGVPVCDGPCVCVCVRVCGLSSRYIREVRTEAAACGELNKTCVTGERPGAGVLQPT